MMVRDTIRQAFTLAEIMITVSIFTGLGLLMAVLTEQFVGTYLKSRDLSDLQRVSNSLFEELSKGDRMDFDGLAGAVEIIEAGDRSLSIVPTYRDVSLPIGEYLDNLTNTQTQDGGAPTEFGVTTGGLRVQYNTLANQYELRWYLAKHPRAGGVVPQVYLQKNLADDAVVVGNQASSTVYLPSRLVWRSPGNRDQFSRSYVVLTGGASPLTFPGGSSTIPSRSVIQQIMATNPARLFPNPFVDPKDVLSVYYQPEVEPNIIQRQQDLIAHVVIKDNFFDPFALKYEFVNDSASLSAVNELPDSTLFLYYDRKVTILPSQTSLFNTNFTNFRLQFPTTVPSESNQQPSRFSYYSSRSTSVPIEMQSYPGGNRVPSELLSTIGMVRMELQMLTGALQENIGFREITSRSFAQIVPLENLLYTQAISTKSSVLNQELGFARENCLPGAKADLRCRKITGSFPSGNEMKADKTFFLSGLTWDSSVDQSLRGSLAVVVRSLANQRIYKVLIDFETNSIVMMKKNSYLEEDYQYDPDIPDDKVTGFPIDNSQFLNFTNLQASGFVDEEFNYIHPEIYLNHMGDSEFNELYLEINTLSNLEGLSLTYRPR